MSKLKVKAKFDSNKFGFYGEQRRYDGQEFLLSEAKHFSENWMEAIGWNPKNPPKENQKTLSMPSKGA